MVCLSRHRRRPCAQADGIARRYHAYAWRLPVFQFSYQRQHSRFAFYFAQPDPKQDFIQTGSVRICVSRRCVVPWFSNPHPASTGANLRDFGKNFIFRGSIAWNGPVRLERRIILGEEIAGGKVYRTFEWGKYSFFKRILIGVAAVFLKEFFPNDPIRRQEGNFHYFCPIYPSYLIMINGSYRSFFNDADIRNQLHA